MRHPIRPLMFSVAALLATSALNAETLLLSPSKESRIHAECSSSVHDFVTEVNAPIVSLETGDGVAGIKSARVTVDFSNGLAKLK